MLLGITGMQAQEFTLEYNIGYGLYNMSEMKLSATRIQAGRIIWPMLPENTG